MVESVFVDNQTIVYFEFHVALMFLVFVCFKVGFHLSFFFCSWHESTYLHVYLQKEFTEK